MRILDFYYMEMDLQTTPPGNSHNIDNNGTLNINTSIYKFGNNSYYFNGNTRLRVNKPTDLNFSTNLPFTIDFWIYPESHTNISTLISGNVNTILAIRLTADNKIAIGAGTSNILLQTNESIPLNEWSHIAIIRIDTLFLIYVNGSLKASASVSLDFSINGNNLTIGATGTSAYYKGYMDEIRISAVSRWKKDFIALDREYSNIQKIEYIDSDSLNEYLDGEYADDGYYYERL